MYDDPTHVRDREIEVRLNDEELALVDAVARFNHRQRAAFIREVLMACVAGVESQVNDHTQAA